MTWRLHWATVSKLQELRFRWLEIGLGLSPDKQHTLYTSVQRSFALIGGQKNSLALIGYPRPRVLVMSTVFWQGRKVENLTSEPSSWLPLVEQQPWARPKRSTRRELFFKLEGDNKYTAERKRGRWQYEK